MRHCLAGLLLSATLLRPADSPPRAPVLVELFTSEGCSSCPPADQLLEQLDSQAVVLSEHVTYWNHEGWKDPYSSNESTARQQAYCRRMDVDSAYTPQMVVDGDVEFAGNLAKRARQEIARAAREPKAGVHLQRTGDGLLAEVDPSPMEGGVFLAVADDRDVSQVSAGENKGQELRHVAVVRSIRKIGALKRNTTFREVVKLPYGAANQRLIVFVQEPGPGKVNGAAMLPSISSH